MNMNMGWTSSFLKFRFLHSFGSKWGEHPICWVRIFHPIAPNDIMRMGHHAKKETLCLSTHCYTCCIIKDSHQAPLRIAMYSIRQRSTFTVFFPCLLTANSWFQRDNFGASCLRHQRRTIQRKPLTLPGDFGKGRLWEAPVGDAWPWSRTAGTSPNDGHLNGRIIFEWGAFEERAIGYITPKKWKLSEPIL